MRRRSRARRVLKWVGTTVAVLIAVPLVMSRWYIAAWVDGRHSLVVGAGRVVLHRVQDDKAPLPFAWGCGRFPSGYYWWIDYWRIGNARAGFGWAVAVPLWIPFVSVGVLSGLLWYGDHRRDFPRGHCRKCGYDLTGNVSGRCPECGTLL